MKPQEPVGKCRFCQCTREHPCTLANGDECGFATKLANRCTAPACVRAFEREIDAELEAERQRRRRLQTVKQQIRDSRRRRPRWRKAA